MSFHNRSNPTAREQPQLSGLIWKLMHDWPVIHRDHDLLCNGMKLTVQDRRKRKRKPPAESGGFQLVEGESDKRKVGLTQLPGPVRA